LNKKISLWTALILVVITACGSFLAFSFFVGGRGTVSKKTAEIERIISKYYIDEYDENQLADAAAAAMVAATGDPWSYYISAENYGSYLESSENAYVGIGITIEEEEGGLRILSVTANGPADKAKILAGDLLVKVDGIAVVDLGLDGSKDKIRGQVGTQVTLELERNGENYTVTVHRESIQVQVVTWQVLEGQIGYIKITDFDTFSCKQTLDAISAVLQEGAEGIVFDVRFNPGGQKDELVDILDKLLPEGVLFRSVDYAGVEETEYSDATCLEVPMAVLINAESYSAAEFFAAALQEYSWATVVGDKTTGKGNFQVVIPLSDGSAVGLSIGKYFTPEGVSLNERGVTPDVQVSLSQEDFAALYYGTLDTESDEQLQAALQTVKNLVLQKSLDTIS